MVPPGLMLNRFERLQVPIFSRAIFRSEARYLQGKDSGKFDSRYQGCFRYTDLDGERMHESVSMSKAYDDDRPFCQPTPVARINFSVIFKPFR